MSGRGAYLNKLILSLKCISFFIVFVLIAASVAADQYVATGCEELNSENSTYILEEELFGSSTCLYITANNITLDCAGFPVIYGSESTGHGVNIIGVNNTVIKNCVFIKSGSDAQESAGIYAELSNGSLFFNNTFNTVGDYSYGIFLLEDYFSNVTGNIINTSGSYTNAISLSASGYNIVADNEINTAIGNDAYGIAFFESPYNSITNNTIITNGTSSGYGIFLSTSSGYNFVSQNSVFTHGSEGGNYGVYIDDSAGVNVSLNSVVTNGLDSNYGVFFAGGSDNGVIGSNTIVAQGNDGGNYGVFVNSGCVFNISGNNVSTNGTYENFGIRLSEVNDFLVSQNSVFASGSEGGNYGVYVYDSAGVNVSLNSVVTNGLDSNYGVFLARGSDACLVDGNSVFAYGLSGENYGVFVSTSYGVNVRGNNISTNGTYDNNGLYAYWSIGSIVSGNNITASGISGNHGIKLASGSDNSIISQNIIVTNGTEGRNYGIDASWSSGINISHNDLYTGGTGSNHGIFLEEHSDSSLVSQNNISTSSNSSSGIYIQSSNSATITGNIIRAAMNLSFAMQLESSDNSVIFNNVFNTTEAQVNISSDGVNNFSTVLTGGANILGYSYIGGNYYDNSTVGGLKGFSCLDADRNGICDSAYQIVVNNIDYYPLTIPPAAPVADQGQNNNGNSGSRSSGSSGGGSSAVVKKDVVAAPKIETPKQAKLPEPVAEPIIPAQLFDIKLELEQNVIYDSRNLAAWVTFESFGRVPTPVDLTYVVLDGSGNEVYSEKAYVTVSTEEFVSKRFTHLDLMPGNYTLILRTLYNSDVMDEFKQGFEVVGAKKQGSLASLVWPTILTACLVALVAGACVFSMSRQKKHRKAKRRGK
jgi:parallel beta-helix repeat protein